MLNCTTEIAAPDLWDPNTTYFTIKVVENNTECKDDYRNLSLDRLSLLFGFTYAVVGKYADCILEVSAVSFTSSSAFHTVA